MPGGGLMQLVAFGAQISYVNGTQMPFWSTGTHRTARHGSHTNVVVNPMNDLTDLTDLTGLEIQNEFDINKWPIKYIIILETDRNTECPINLEQIRTNDQYCKCNRCKYNFSKEALIESFNTKISCPMCREQWTDKTLYINNRNLMEEVMNKRLKKSDKENKKNTNTNKLIESKNGVQLTKHNKRFYYGR